MEGEVAAEAGVGEEVGEAGGGEDGAVGAEGLEGGELLGPPHVVEHDESAPALRRLGQQGGEGLGGRAAALLPGGAPVLHQHPLHLPQQRGVRVPAAVLLLAQREPEHAVGVQRLQQAVHCWGG